MLHPSTNRSQNIWPASRSGGWSRCPYRDPTGADPEVRLAWARCPAPDDPSVRRRRWQVGRCAASAPPSVCSLAVLAGCSTGIPPDPRPTDTPDRAAAELAAGLTNKDLTAVEFVGATGTEVNQLFQPLVTGMGARQPRVTVSSVDRQGQHRHRHLEHHLDLPGRRSLVLHHRGVVDRGRRPVEDELAAQHPPGPARRHQPAHPAPARRRARRAAGRTAKRSCSSGPWCGSASTSRSSRPAAVDASVRRLARLVGIDAKAYAERVAEAGPSAFVEAIVFRATDPERPGEPGGLRDPRRVADRGRPDAGDRPGTSPVR